MLILAYGMSAKAQVSILPGQGVTFNQVNFLDGNARIDSETGTMLVDFAALRAATSMSEGFINVAMDGNWLIRNFPVLPVSDFPYEGLSINFDLFVAPGDDVTDVDLDVQMSVSPNSTFTPMSNNNFAVGEQDVAIGGEGGAGETAPPPRPFTDLERNAVVDVLVDNDNRAFQGNHPNVEAARNQCGPMSIANSLQYLANETDLELPNPHKPGIRGETVPDGEKASLVSELDEAMERPVPDASNRNDPNAGGRAVEDQLKGKLKYLLDNGLQDKVKTVFWSPFDNSDESITYTDPDDPGSSLTATHMGKNFGVADMVKCLRAGGDVEAGYYWTADPNDPTTSGGAHAVDVVGAGSITSGERKVDYFIELSDTNQSSDSNGTGREGYGVSVLKDTDGDGTLNMGPRTNLKRMFCQTYVPPPEPVEVETPVSGVDDSEGHGCCVFPTDSVFLTQGPGTITIAGNQPWLPATGTRTNGAFIATSNLTVAGFPNTTTTCTGTYNPFAPNNSMTCVVGDNGALNNSGVPIIFDFELNDMVVSESVDFDFTLPPNTVQHVPFGSTLEIQDDATFTVNGQLDVQGRLIVAPGGGLVVNGTISMDGIVDNHGAFGLNPGGHATNNALFTNTSTGVFTTRGTFINNHDFTNNGPSIVGPGGRFVNSHNFTNNTTGDLNVVAGGLFSNVNGGGIQNFGPNSIHNSGAILNGPGSSISNIAPGNFVNESTGTIYNRGAITNDSDFTNNGDFEVLCEGILGGSSAVTANAPMVASDCIVSAGDSDGDGINDMIDPYPSDINNNPVDRLLTIWQVAEIYIATLNRATDAEGLAFWVNNILTRPEWEPLTVAQSFFDQPEVQAMYPPGDGFEAFIIALYRNILGRAPDGPGFDFWLNELQQGILKRNDMIIALINGAWANPDAIANGDVARFRNRIKVGLAFARYQERNNILFTQLSDEEKVFLLGTAVDVLDSVGSNSNDDDIAIVKVPALMEPLVLP